MKRWHIIVIGLFLLSACNQQPAKDKAAENLAAQIQEIKDKYKPGLGEYMIGIQLHHSKLWFAGINNNWKLADYEIGEIKESFDNIKNVETERPEVKTIDMIQAPLDSLASTITQKDEVAFKKRFEVLTATCNNCHSANKFEFNVITIPTAPPVSNQDFKPHH
jgi:hypothetical protein